ncbi:PAS domain-containing protein [Sphingomonas faeni]|uniref:PAS domain-containing protein n=1 Tax=Sphingomonas faeni TaxID=185950 RepID=UPI00335BA25F
MTTARSVADGREAGADILARGETATQTTADADARASTDAGVNDVMFDLGGDERRMHVRAYNHWVSLLDGRPYPSIANLEPETITDFGPHSVLLDFSHGMGDPKIAYLGRALREECGLEGPIATIADVPSRSLLSRLTDHYLQIIANRAPIGFEAEFVSSRGRTTLYRGILMPFASGGVTIDFIYGVINWKELADADLQAALSAELDAAVHATPQGSGTAAQVWADGPSGGFDVLSAEPMPVQALVLDDPLAADYVLAGPFGEQLAMARENAAQVRAAEARSRAALHRTLGRAHDLAVSTEHDDGDLATLFAAACLPGQTDVMMQIVTLVFGANFEAARLETFAAVLRHAQRHQVPAGGFASFIGGFDGDLAAIAAAERSAS